METFDEIKSVVLKDTREIHLSDENELWLSMVSDGKTLFEYQVEYPSAGYGGGTLYLSPDDEYLLFSYYSGQSEEAFTLFKIGEKLDIVYSSDYLFGEVASYGFSQNEKLLIQCLPNSCTLWDWKDYMGQGFAERDEYGNLFFVFGYINVLDIVKKVLHKHLIRVYPSEDAENFSEEEYDPIMSPTMKNDSKLTIKMPWGEETLIFPFNDIITFRLN